MTTKIIQNVCKETVITLFKSSIYNTLNTFGFIKPYMYYYFKCKVMVVQLFIYSDNYYLSEMYLNKYFLQCFELACTSFNTITLILSSGLVVFQKMAKRSNCSNGVIKWFCMLQIASSTTVLLIDP